jgi:hypothetical protein
MTGVIKSIRDQHKSCVTTSCNENKCSFQLDSESAGSRAIIHGGKYQKHYNFNGKLCDRIVFCEVHGLILAAVELKGGDRIRLSEAIEQIQNGLDVADSILGQKDVADWLPLLIYSGRMKPAETKLLTNKSVKFRGKPKNVIKRDCGTKLSEVL